ncbi:MAG TPA: citrate transporter [Gammaproteobacteria bacterium]|nr:citrate transporter [Gammaproteobacteria bacterium]
MEAAVEGLTQEMVISAIILLAAYTLVFTERLHRTNAAVIGAVIMVAAGTWFDFYTQEQAVKAIDANTMFLLTGMMILVTILKPTGGFEYLAIRVAKTAARDPRLLLVYLSLAVSVTSMLLDNVTTVIIFAPLTALICRLLNINPLPYLMAEAMMSNIGGIATLVGDPPNIMIGSAADIDFNQFLLHMGPVVAVVWLSVIVLVLWQFRRELRPPPGFTGIIDLNEDNAIRDRKTLGRAIIALGCVLVLFVLHHHLHFYPAYVTFIGVALAFVLVKPDPDTVLRQLEWPVLLFFIALFVIVGGVQNSGLLELIGRSLARFASDPERLLLTCLILMWVAGLLSTVLDNIPFTITMIPIVLDLELAGVNATPLWWALALGVGLGGNGSHIGATANVICVAESERCERDESTITPGIWLQKGLPVMFLSLAIASLLFALFFSFFE